MTRSDAVDVELFQMTDSGYGGYQDVSVSGEARFDGYDNVEVDFKVGGNDDAATFRLYHEENGDVYLPLRTQGTTGPTDWTMRITRNGEANTATTTRTATPTPTRTPTATRTPTPTTTTSLPSTPTLTPTPTPTEASTPTATRVPTPTDMRAPTTATDGGSPDSDGDGVGDSEDYAPEDPGVQAKSDLANDSSGPMPGPGFGVALVALLVTAFLGVRRS